jgi:hypothetical protein
MNRQLTLGSSAMRALLVLTIAAIAQSGALARAATISITPDYVQSFAEGLVPLGALPNDGAATPVGGMLHYEFRMSVNDLMAGEDFWVAIFNIELGPGLEFVTGWMDPGTAQANELYAQSPSLATYDSNGAVLGGIEPHWEYGNADFGLDPDDLQTIIVETSSQEATNRQYGEVLRPTAGSPDALGSPTLVGAILVRRLEMIPSFLSLSPIDGDAWGIYEGNTLGDGLPTSLPPGTFGTSPLILEVPEPTMLSLGLTASAALLLYRRRTRRG